MSKTIIGPGQLHEALGQPSVIGEWTGPHEYRDPEELKNGEKVVVTEMLEGQPVIIGSHKDCGRFIHVGGYEPGESIDTEEWFKAAHAAIDVNLDKLMPELAEQLICDGVVLYCLIPNDQELPSRLYLCDVGLWNNEAVLDPLFGEGCVRSGLYLQPWDVLLRCAHDLNLPTEPEVYVGQHDEWLSDFLCKPVVEAAIGLREKAFGLSVRSYDELHYEDGGPRYMKNYYKD